MAIPRIHIITFPWPSPTLILGMLAALGQHRPCVRAGMGFARALLGLQRPGAWE